MNKKGIFEEMCHYKIAVSVFSYVFYVSCWVFTFEKDVIKSTIK